MDDEASAADIAAYWEQHKNRPQKNRDITDLTFINWTRLDPYAATAATKSTNYDEFSWWAWACHDPHTALAHSISTHPDRIPNVTWGIGEFHGEWLRENFDSIPESGKRNALMALCKWDDVSEPLEILKFLKQHNADDMGMGIFRSLARQDPWAAHDWLKENGGFSEQNHLSKDFFAILETAHPQILERMEKQTETQRNLAYNWSLYDPEAARQWIDSQPAATKKAIDTNLKERLGK